LRLLTKTMRQTLNTLLSFPEIMAVIYNRSG
jgi:hypothetical protein